MYKIQMDSLKNNQAALEAFFLKNNHASIIYFLERLGKIENNYSKEPLLSLLNHSSASIRRLAIKNLAKMRDASLLNTFAKLAYEDKSTAVRREAVSAIGRLRNQVAIPILIKLLVDQDPKVVMQAIRALLIFSNHSQVKKKLAELLSHPNEMIKEAISKEVNQHYDQKTTSRHDIFPKYLKNAVVHGDVVDIMQYIPDESIHLTFTSPPYYNAKDYSIYQSYEDYLGFLAKACKQIYRITKEGRFFILNTSPIIIPRISRSHSSKRYPIPYDIHPLLVKIGWEFIDDIVWVKPEASVKNRNAGFLQHRKPLAYKPNTVTEMLMVYRKKTSKLIDWNIRQYAWDTVKKSKVVAPYERTNIWHVDPTFDKVHSAVFPVELCNKVIKYYSFIGDLIFDPFAGRGTLGWATANLHRYFFLAEKELNYFNLIKTNLSKLISRKNTNIRFFDTPTFSKQTQVSL